ncbi:MAG: tyrosine-type recombinase/integrase [Methanomicrobiaceae archaeon]|nr:tyrosine-type recombinase/integrase [Methanomicrobiaceae archaeon]
MPRTQLRAPRRSDRSFHNVKAEYGDRTLDRAIDSGLLEPAEAELLREYIADLEATSGIGVSRANKIITILTRWRSFIDFYSDNQIGDLHRGISKFKQARYQGHPYTQNTVREYLTFLKRFYRWLVRSGNSWIDLEEVDRIRPPAWDTMTKTASQLLTEEGEVGAMIDHCLNARDRALIAMLYEGGFRIIELGTLTWEQVQFDEYGMIVNVNCKTEKARYVRLVMITLQPGRQHMTASGGNRHC